MTDLTTTESPGTVPVSTIINDGTTPQSSGGGVRAADLAPAPPEKPQGKPESVRDTLEAVSKEIGKDAEKDEQKPARDDKAEPPAKDDEAEKDAKASTPAEEPAEKADKREAEKPAAGRDGDEGRQSEGRKHTEPPARFLPEARTKWANVPNEVKAEVHRVSQEYEAELNQGREARERYEPIRQFDEIARRNGGSLEQSLHRVSQIEDALARNPIAGLDMILREAGPRKPDGSPMSLAEVAQFVVSRTPQQMQQLMQVPQQQQRQPDPEVIQLRQQMAQMQTQMASATLMPVLDQFAARHPDYHALEPQIAAILKTGVIDQIFGAGLSPEQKLSEAYRMAGGTPSQSGSEAIPAPDTARPVNPDAGTKSVRGAPNGGEEPQIERPAKSTRDLLREEMRRLNRS